MSANEDVIVSLGKFIYDGFKLRDQICINTSWNVYILIVCFFFYQFYGFRYHVFTFYRMKSY